MSFLKKISTATFIVATLASATIVTSPTVLAAVNKDQQVEANEAAVNKAKELNELLKQGKITLDGPKGAAQQLAEHVYNTLVKIRDFAATPEEIASAVATATNQAGLSGLTGMLAASAAATVVPGLAVKSVISIAPTVGAAGGALGGISTSYIVLALAGVAGLAAVGNSGGGNNNKSGG